MSGVSCVAFKRYAEPTLGKMLQPAQALPDEVLAPYLKAGHVTWKGLNLPEVLPEMWVKESNISELHPNVGDLLVCEGGEVGRATLVTTPLDSSTIIQNSVHLVRPGVNANTRYLKYALEQVASSGWLDIVCNKATIAHLTVDKLRELQVPFQRLADQERIANFLDDKTARIDALIAEKGELARAVEELRESVISDSVTLSNVPGWRQTRLKFLVQDIIDTEHKTVPFQDNGEYLVARTTNIKKGRLVLDGAKYTDMAGFEEWTKRATPSLGDILFTREAPAGEACLVPENVSLCLGQRTVLIRLRKDLAHAPFVLWSFYGGLASKFISDLSQGSTVAHFNMPDIGNIPLFTGPLEDQSRRADELEIKLRQMDDLSAHIQDHIARLREYRSSLISAAVTGQLDLSTFKDPA